MNPSTNTPVIVVTEEKKRRKGLALVAGGAALLLGGSTFALWSANDQFSGRTIQAGDLQLEQLVDTSFWDVSSDRMDAISTVTGTDGTQPGHTIDDHGMWRIVPGDKVAASFSAEVTLKGDNLVASVSLDGVSSNELINEEMTYTYEVYQDSMMLISETPLPDTNGEILLYLSAPADGQESGLEDADGVTVFAMTNATENFTVVIYGAFAEDTTDRGQVGVFDTLAQMTLTLSQVRAEGAQFQS